MRCAIGIAVFVLSLAAASVQAIESSVEVNDNLAEENARVPPHPSAAAMAALGRKLFFDNRLSASHKLSCSSCHDPAHAYGPPNARPVQAGGKLLQKQGQRAAPSLRYLQAVPVFTEHYFDEDKGDESIDNGPTGGLTWDGRVRNPREQARIPLLSVLEMANPSEAAVVSAVATSPYASEFVKVFGEHVFDDTNTAFAAITRSLEVFQQEPTEFFPYTSKYDAYLRRQTELTAEEQRGLEAFNDEGKGNCAQCHPSQIGQGGAFPAFSDFGYIAIGVPRNRALASNRDPAFFDLGLCGPLRNDFAQQPQYCGLFRTPSLRNVALRRTFFHNGAFGSLRRVVEFYNEREVHPEKFYTRDSAGKVQLYDDLPAQYADNINKETPFDRGPGEPPRLTDAEVASIVAFLRTLTDGWKPGAP